MSARRLTLRGMVIASALTGSLALFSASAIAAAPEAPETKPATVVGGFTATLNGVLNPKVAAPAGWHFVYSPEGQCAGGPNAVTTPTEPETEGSSIGEPESLEVGGLVPNHQYTFCFVSTHVEDGVNEATLGGPLTFKTLGVAPAAEINPAFDRGEGLPVLEGTPFEATLGEVLLNPENRTTECVFQYVKESDFIVSKFAGAAKVPCEQGATIAGYGFQTVGATVTKLQPGTIYRDRLLAKNASGETEVVGTITTPSAVAPSIEVTAPSDGQTSVTLTGLVNPDFQKTTCTFQYLSEAEFDQSGYAAPHVLPCEPAVGEGSWVGTNGNLTGLESAAIYHYRIVATNESGEAKSPDQMFVTLPYPPDVTTGQATPDADGSETIGGSVNGHGNGVVHTTYAIQYGLSTSYGSQLVGDAGTGNNAVSEVGSISNLQPGATYHYRMTAKSTAGETVGSDSTFIAPASAPAVGSQSAQFVNEDSAVIQGEANPEGLEATYVVQYGTGTAYGSDAPMAPTEMAPYTSMHATITGLAGLAPGTTYHYRLAVTNQVGTTYGQDDTFTTTGAPLNTTFTSFALPTTPLIAVPSATFPSEKPIAKGTPKTLSNKQKLANALKACAKKPKKQRAGCQRRARKLYGARQKKAKKK